MSYNLTNNAIIEIQALGRLHGQRIRNTFKYRYVGSTPLDGPTTLDAMAEEFRDEILTPMAAQQSEDMLWDGIQIQHVKLPRHRARFLATSIQGQVAEASLPSTSCLVLRRVAQQSGHRFQGRIFVAGIPISSVDDSQLDPGLFAAWTAIASGLKEPLEGGTETEPFVPVIHVANPVSDIDDVDQTSVDQVLRVQRRREVGVGE